MTRRGRAALGLGVLTYVAGWAFGSRPLYVVAVGLIFTVLLAWLADEPVPEAADVVFERLEDPAVSRTS